MVETNIIVTLLVHYSTHKLSLLCDNKINVGLTQAHPNFYSITLFLHTDFCQGGQIDDSICNYNATTDNTSSCVSATLQCENMMCSAVISGSSRTCHFTNIGDTVISQPIQCCYCNNSLIPIPWWDCEYVTTPSPSISPPGECIIIQYRNLPLSQKSLPLSTKQQVLILP